MSNLDMILDSIIIPNSGPEDGWDIINDGLILDNSLKDTKKRLIKLLLDVIGDNDLDESTEIDSYIAFQRNKLRAEQREKVNKL